MKQILKLFPEVVYTKILDIDIQPYIDPIKQLEWTKSGHLNNRGEVSEASVNLYIFEEELFKPLADELMKEFNLFKDDILNYQSNEFLYTTSWGTKTEPLEQSEWHNHNNCLYSGIFYMQVGDNTGNLMFQDFNKKNLSLTPSSYNEYNSISWQIEPKDKMLVLFPSHLYHKIGRNMNKDKARYSIAFNLMPMGDMGKGDSKLILDI